MKKRAKDKKVYVLCDNIRSLYNVGSIFRTSDGAGIVKKIFLTGMTGYPKQNDPDHHQTARIAKTSLGAEKNIDWHYEKDSKILLQKLKNNGVKIYALENNIKKIKPKDYSSIKYDFPLVLVIGHEVRGVSSEILDIVDETISIPMNGIKESLNVASAYAIAIYEILKQL